MKYFILLITLTFPIKTLALPLIADVSQHMIEMDSDFSGTELIVFGTIDSNANVAITLTGPQKSIRITKKGKVLGMWVVTEYSMLAPLPLLYFTRSSENPEQISWYNRNAFRLGIENLLYNTQSTPYLEAFIKRQKHGGLYREDGNINFINKLFHSVFKLPANTPPGRYSIEVMMFKDNKIIGAQSIPLIVKRTGTEAKIYELHKEHPFIYGIITISTTLLIGLAHRTVSATRKK